MACEGDACHIGFKINIDELILDNDVAVGGGGDTSSMGLPQTLLTLGGNLPTLSMWQYWWAFGSALSAVSLLYHSWTAIRVLQKGPTKGGGGGGGENGTSAMMYLYNPELRDSNDPQKEKQNRQEYHVEHMISACVSFNVPGILRACGLLMQLTVLENREHHGCDYLNSSGDVTVQVLGVLIPVELLIRWSVFGWTKGYKQSSNMTRLVAVLIDLSVGVYTETLFRCVV